MSESQEQTVTLTKSELAEIISKQVAEAMKSMPRKGSSTLCMAKPTEKGGLYVIDSRATAYSDKLMKEYTTNITFHKHQLSLIALICKDKGLRDVISQAIETAKEVRK